MYKSDRTMKELLLLIALVIAILLDLVRIYQYVKMRKATDPKAKADTIVKIEKLYRRWMAENVMMPLGEYIVEHLEDKE